MIKEIIIKDWCDISIKEAKKILNIRIPSKLMELYKSKNLEEYNNKYNKFEFEDFLIFADYYGKIISLLTDIKDVEYLQWFDRQTIYEQHCQDIIVNLLAEIPNYTPKNIEFFEYENIKYYLPKSLKIFDSVIPAYKEQAITFTEGNALYRSLLNLQEGIDKLPYFIAVYCRPQEEKYDEDKILERAEKFWNVSMEVVWEVFFCTTRLLGGFLNDTNIYFQDQIKKIESLQNQD